MGNKGQSLVEFAISLVFIMFLLAGLVEFGIIFLRYIQLRDAAQEGALYGSYCECGLPTISSRVIHSSGSPINLAEDTRVSVDVTAMDRFGVAKDPSLICEGDGLTVRVSYAHHIFMPFLPKLLGVTDLNLSASVTDTVLRPLCS
jgi:hypothetical protein